MTNNIKRNSLVDQVIEKLRMNILRAEWPVGFRLPPENSLAAELGVGRSTIREAVRALAHAGFLEVRQGSGTFVSAVQPAPASTEDNSPNIRQWQTRLKRARILDVFEVRRALELEAARLAAVRRDQNDLDRLNAALATRKAAQDMDDAEAFIKADVEFHTAVVEAAHNPLFSDLFEAFAASLKEAMQLLVVDSELHRDRSAAHEELAKAIYHKDVKLAEEATLKHVDTTLEALHLLLETRENIQV